MTSETTNNMTALETARDFAASGEWSKAGVWAAIAQAEALEKGTAANATVPTSSLVPGAITIHAQPGHGDDALAQCVMDKILQHIENESARPTSPYLNKLVEEARAIAEIHIETMNMRRAAKLAPLAEDVQRARQAIDNYRQVRLEYNEACKNAELRAATATAKQSSVTGGQAS